MLPLVRLPSLDLIKGFVAVARRGSVTQAADDLCVTQSAISKQIRALEDSLGVTLFHRGFRSVELTEHGQMLFRVADGSVQELQQVLALFSSSRRRPVTITASTGVAGLWLLPRLGEFHERYPHIDVRVLANNSVLELGHDVDLAVRYCSPRHAPLGALKLFGETIAPVLSPQLETTCLSAPHELRRMTLLEFDVSGRPWLHWSDWLAKSGLSTSSARGMLHYNQYEQTIQAAVAGQGVALGRLDLLRPMLADGRLRLLDTPGRSPQASDHACWLIQASTRPGEDVLHVVEWLLELAAEVEPREEGIQPGELAED